MYGAMFTFGFILLAVAGPVALLIEYVGGVGGDTAWKWGMIVTSPITVPVGLVLLYGLFTD
jgi:hypothetical protein